MPLWAGPGLAKKNPNPPTSPTNKMNSVTRCLTPVIKRALSTSSPKARNIKDLSPNIKTKFEQLQKDQEFFQRDDGKWIFLKKPLDPAIVYSIVFVNIVLFGFGCDFLVDKYNGKY
ncbi:hypothetical protein M8J76_000184 [Diaphorina citri]|nr:hypothetical protein M8J75_008395 [Diaphorina citri]KAI5721865.1 hypothetical protein M8J76_000184 [Diaphorina citri]